MKWSLKDHIYIQTVYRTMRERERESTRKIQSASTVKWKWLAYGYTERESLRSTWLSNCNRLREKRRHVRLGSESHGTISSTAKIKCCLDVKAYIYTATFVVRFACLHTHSLHNRQLNAWICILFEYNGINVHWQFLNWINFRDKYFNKFYFVEK